MDQPLVAVSTDVRQFDNYTWHAAPQQYLEAAIATAGVLPVLLPSFGDRLDLDRLLASVDGVMITGSKSNVHPSLYGGEASDANGPYDALRDATTLPLIRKAIAFGVPLLAICRGIQELNVALGGTLATELQEREGCSTTAPPPATTRTNGSPSARPSRSSRVPALPAFSGRATSGSTPCIARASTGSASGLRSRRSQRTAASKRFRCAVPRPSRSASSGIPSTGRRATTSRRASSAPSAMPCAPMPRRAVRRVRQPSSVAGLADQRFGEASAAVSATGVSALPSPNHERRLSTTRSAIACRV